MNNDYPWNDRNSDFSANLKPKFKTSGGSSGAQVGFYSQPGLKQKISR
jgi:hypothetical protein